MLWNVRSSAPIVVLATLSAVPVVVVRMLLVDTVSVTTTVAPVLPRGVERGGRARGQVHAAVEADRAAGVAGDVDAAAAARSR